MRSTNVPAAAREFVEVAVGRPEMQPHAVVFDGADYLDSGCDEFSVCGADFVNLEQRDGATRLRPEEVEIWVARSEDLNSIATGQRRSDSLGQDASSRPI